MEDRDGFCLLYLGFALEMTGVQSVSATETPTLELSQPPTLILEEDAPAAPPEEGTDDVPPQACPAK